MQIKIAAIADIHFGGSPLPARRGEIGDILLHRAMRRINEWIKPDITVLLGDLINDGSSPRAAEQFRQLRAIIDEIDSPVIVLPGNHDGDEDEFYRFFDRPARSVDIRGARFMPFLDSEEPRFNSRRANEDIRFFAEAGKNFNGPVVMLQHVPLLPPGVAGCPYGLVNGQDVLREMKGRFNLCISGHHHEGTPLVRSDEGSFVVVPSLCEGSFPFLEIDISDNEVAVTRHELRLPPHLGLADYHVHTPFAYCNENMDTTAAVSLAVEFGLAGISFSEHSGQLYFDYSTYRNGSFLHHGIEAAQTSGNRMVDYLKTKVSAPAVLGLEVDCDFQGRPVMKPGDADGVSLLIGAVHDLPELHNPKPDPLKMADELLLEMKNFLRCGIRVLAHPFRVFRRAGMETPDMLYRPMADMLQESGVAAEINFHTDRPSPEFIRLCVERGVKISLGSDAHNISQIGEFAPHLDFLRECGYAADLESVLFRV